MTSLEPTEIYGTGYSVTPTNPPVTITDINGSTYSGLAGDAFDSFLSSVSLEPAFVAEEAKELRDLWVSGHGYSDRAMTQCASLGVQVSL